MHRARTVDEYVRWVREARDAIADLGDAPGFAVLLRQGMDGLYRDMQEGVYSFGNEDLPFMAIANEHREAIPFMTLLSCINQTHCHGLNIDEEE